MTRRQRNNISKNKKRKFMRKHVARLDDRHTMAAIRKAFPIRMIVVGNTIKIRANLEALVKTWQREQPSILSYPTTELR